MPLWHKNSILVCKTFTHLFNDLINQIEEGWEGPVGVFLQVIFSSLWSEENVSAAGIRRGSLCTRGAEQWATCPAVPLSPPSGTDTNVKLLFVHGSGGMSLVGYAQAPFSALAALTSDCQTPQINDCLSSSACCHPTLVLVGCLRNAWRTESLLSVGEWGYCIFRVFIKPWGDASSWETELQGCVWASWTYQKLSQPRQTQILSILSILSTLSQLPPRMEVGMHHQALCWEIQLLQLFHLGMGFCLHHLSQQHISTC